ncbi:hypothetical protein A2U01_0116159, partial [Trifolium medium]|nr:hypothetical protein [Trifolium medium]
DDQGRFIKARTIWYDGLPSPTEEEAIGLREAISWLGDMGESKMSIELDCKLVVDDIVGNSIN